MSEILAIFVPWVVSLVLMFGLLRWDESRLTLVEKARAWPAASRLVAVVYFGVVCLPVHFGRTRRSLVGVLQGFAWAALVAAIDEGVGAGVELIARQVVPS
jgi:hypothetical protein